MRTALLVGFELGLGLVGLVLGLLAGVAPLETLRLEPHAALVGAAAAGPLLLMVAAAWDGRVGALREIQRSVEHLVSALFPDATLVELALVSLAAGIGEELLFRGFVQGGLQALLGPAPALVAASIVFGLAHPVTRTYALLVTAVGIYLGALWMATGNLLAPLVTHALYDFVVLSVVVRRRRSSRDPRLGTDSQSGG